MNRFQMVCRNCVKLNQNECRLNPQPFPIDNPDSHWCAQGQWHEWSERYQEMEPYFWGEWEERL